jgi:membrane protease YdiL (CAAX protease family)
LDSLMASTSSAFFGTLRAIGYITLFVVSSFVFSTLFSVITGFDPVADKYLKWPFLLAASGVVYWWIQGRLKLFVPCTTGAVSAGAAMGWGLAVSLLFVVTLSAFFLVYGGGDFRLSTSNGLWQPEYLLKLVLLATMEEWLFRGIIFSLLLVVLSAHSALLLQAALFSAVHLLNPGSHPPHVLLGHFTLALLLGRLTQRTGGVLAAAMLHSVSNLFLMCLAKTDSALFGGWGVAAGVRIEIAGFIDQTTLSLARSAFYFLAYLALSPWIAGLIRGNPAFDAGGRHQTHPGPPQDR